MPWLVRTDARTSDVFMTSLWFKQAQVYLDSSFSVEFSSALICIQFITQILQGLDRGQQLILILKRKKPQIVLINPMLVSVIKQCCKIIFIYLEGIDGKKNAIFRDFKAIAQHGL